MWTWQYEHLDDLQNSMQKLLPVIESQNLQSLNASLREEITKISTI